MSESTSPDHLDPHAVVFLQALLENSSDVISILDPDGTVRYVSPSVERVLGYRPEELVGKDGFELVHPDDLERVRTAFARRVLERDLTQVTEYRCLHKDGSWRVVETTGRNRLDDPAVRGMVLNSRDVTEQRQARAALEKSEQYYRALFENAADVITVLDEDGTVRYESPSLERVFGWKPEELLGRNVFEFVHPDDVGSVMGTLEQILRHPGEVLAYRLRFLHKDGSWRVLDGLGQNLLHNPAVRGVVANSRDITDQAAAEEANRRLAVVVESSEDAIISKTLEGTILTWNRGAERVLGYSAAEAVGQSILSMVPPDEHAGERDILERLGRGESLSHYETARIHKDGRRVPISLSLAPVRDAENRVVAVSAIARDVTERRRMEDEIRASNERYRLVGRVTRDAVWEWNIAADELTWGEGIRSTFGYASREVPTDLDWWSERIHPEDLPGVIASLEEALAGEQEAWSREYRFLRADGSYAEVLDRGLIIRNEQGEAERMIGSVADITERVQAEEELQRQRAYLRAVIDTDPNLIFAKDRDGRFTLANRAVAEVYGTTPEALLGKTDADFNPDLAEVDHFRRVDGEVIRTGRALFVEQEPVTNPVTGEVRWFQTRKVQFFPPGGGDPQVLGVASDITARVRTEEELIAAKEAAEAASRAKSDFLSSMSHELRTPLNAVIGFTNVLRKNKGGNLREQDLSYLERILSNGKHLLGLINDILDLSKIEAGKVELEVAPVALESLVVETLDQLRGALRGKPVELRTAIPEDMAATEADAGKLKQVLINLIGNAIKFTERGSVTVAVVVDPETRRPLRIDVRDTGIGISAERLSAIFDPFEQAESGTARRYEGTGLGLAISRSLSELMGFRLEVESTVGEGSTFSILLAPEQAPGGAAARAAADRTAATAEPAPAVMEEEGVDFSGKLVLIIDDETEARMLLTHHLEEFGTQTIAASTGEQGLRMAREFRPDLITLDLLMPGMAGWEILRALKADPELCDIPVVVVSVAAEESRGNVLGTVDLLEKPIKQSELLAVLQRNLRPETSGRVLIVDDEADARELLSAYLHEEEVEVRSAANGREALQHLEGFTPDLIVLDLLMPELDGIGLLRILQESERYRHIPVVVVTAKDLSPAEIRSLGREVQAVLRKDAELEADLRAVIQHICRRREQMGSSVAVVSGGASESEG